MGSMSAAHFENAPSPSTLAYNETLPYRLDQESVDTVLSLVSAFRFVEKKPLIEIRKASGDVIQVAVTFASPVEREQFLLFSSKQSIDWSKRGLSLQLGGRCTVEIGQAGISKATVMKFLRKKANLAHLLEHSGYVPGTINVRRSSPWIVVADADGTLIPSHGQGVPREGRHLLNSAAREPLLAYLEKGGFLLINTGNDAERIRNKILRGIPKERRSVLRNIALAGSGGRVLYLFNEKGELKEFKEYRQSASRYMHLDYKDVAMLYIGDDPTQEGNDWNGFVEAGFDFSFCVVNESIPSSKVPQKLASHLLPGNDASTKRIFEELNRLASTPSFSLSPAQARALLDKARAIQAPQDSEKLAVVFILH